MYAIVILVLVAIAGVGFDYGRMAGLDTEIQDASDHAALAGATQLDGKNGACARAADAARTFVQNNTRIANDGQTPLITFVAGAATCAGIADATTGSFIRFWQDRDKVTAADSDANAKFIEVGVNARAVRYALTPLVGRFSSGLMNAAALAGLGSSICRVPPVFMCNPNEADTLGGVGADFDANGLAGAGVTLLAGSASTPGNFGFLDTNYDTPGQNNTPNLAKALGWDISPGDCAPITGVGLKPGQRDVVFDAFNTRFDIDQNGSNTCPGVGPCSAALVTRKDLIRNNQCGTNGNNGWQEPPTPYRPTTTTPITSGYPEVMGYPRDICHAISFDGTCASGIIGNKVWDRDAFFHVNYNWTPSEWQANTGLGPSATRFQVYEWEGKNPNSDFASRSHQVVGTKAADATPVCRTAAGTDVPDRRRITMAVVNCRDEQPKIQGNGVVEVLKWVDVFLVEPAFNRGTGASKVTTDDQVYVEIIKQSELAGGGDTAQTVRHDVPFLVQ